MTRRLGFPTDGPTLFLRTAIAKAAQARSGILASDYARRRGWGAEVVEALTTKASVSAGETDSGWATALAIAGAQFLELVDSTSILGRLEFAHRIPPATPYAYTATGVAATWVGQSKGIDVATLGLGSGGLFALKLAQIICVSNELLESNDARSEPLIKNAMSTAIAHGTDLAFIGGGAGTSGIEPQAINYNVSGLTSAVTALGDGVAELLEGFRGDLATSSWIASPAAAAQILLVSGGVGLGTGVALRGGGTFLGLPLLITTASESTSSGSALTLVDGARVAIVDEGIEVTRSPDAVLEMSDSPAGASDTPSAITQSIVSVFQENATAFRAIRRCNWFAPAGAVAVLSLTW